MSTTINLDSEKYGEFIRCLSLLKDNCNDVNIVGGIIRQKITSDAALFEIDLRPIIGECNLPISLIKQKLELFRCFLNQEVSIDIDDNCYSFSDEYSNFKIKIPLPEYMDNKFVERTSTFEPSEEDIILTTDINKTISDRIRIVSQVFNTINVQINFEGENASISSRTSNTEQSAKFLSNIISDKEMQGYINIVSEPFVIDCDSDIKLKIYDSNNNTFITCKFSTSISNVDINIYSKSKLFDED